MNFKTEIKYLKNTYLVAIRSISIQLAFVADHNKKNILYRLTHMCALRRSRSLSPIRSTKPAFLKKRSRSLDDEQSRGIKRPRSQENVTGAQ